MQKHSNNISRRDFLKWLGTSGTALLLAGCRPQPPGDTPHPTLPNQTLAPATSTAAPPTLPAPPTTTATSAQASATETSAPPTGTPTPPPKATVAIGQANNYNPGVIRQQIEKMLIALGGIGRLVKPGARVGVKVNLTGGTWWDGDEKPLATELFVTHPTVARAVCELLLDAGASTVTVMDGLGDTLIFEQWGYTEMASSIGVELLDLCQPDPYQGFVRLPVGTDAYIYNQFYCHPILGELDVFVSIAKMKCHSVAGVTLSLKNMIGIVPISEYRLNEQQNNRSALHGNSQFDTRLPRVILDLARARPIHLAIIDGVITADRGAGPWDTGLTQIQPGLLVASRDPVAADAVSTALMGFSPLAVSGAAPFLHCENYLALAHELGLGTNLLEEIGIAGPAIQDVIYSFHLPD